MNLLEKNFHLPIFQCLTLLNILYFYFCQSTLCSPQLANETATQKEHVLCICVLCCPEFCTSLNWGSGWSQQSISFSFSGGLCWGLCFTCPFRLWSIDQAHMRLKLHWYSLWTSVNGLANNQLRCQVEHEHCFLCDTFLFSPPREIFAIWNHQR